jgi:S-methylmethionine-dependent homocysteine/selenocysteine methylase
MGTELKRRGVSTMLPLWSAQALFDDPGVVKEIHMDYVHAGADIITTNSFRTQKRTLTKAGLESETERINKLAVELAVQARKEAGVERPILIAGSITTLEDCYRPDLVPEQRQLDREHAQHVEILASTSIDFFLLETFNSGREVRTAAHHASNSGKPLAISFVLNPEGNILSGESLAWAIETFF